MNGRRKWHSSTEYSRNWATGREESAEAAGAGCGAVDLCSVETGIVQEYHGKLHKVETQISE